MNYKLIEKLEKSGFNFKHDEDCTGKECHCISLSSLIDACGDGFISLLRGYFRNKPIWICRRLEDINTEIRHSDYHKTKKTAVAKLYLKLNKK